MASGVAGREPSMFDPGVVEYLLNSFLDTASGSARRAVINIWSYIQEISCHGASLDTAERISLLNSVLGAALERSCLEDEVPLPAQEHKGALAGAWDGQWTGTGGGGVGQVIPCADGTRAMPLAPLRVVAAPAPAPAAPREQLEEPEAPRRGRGAGGAAEPLLKKKAAAQKGRSAAKLATPVQAGREEGVHGAEGQAHNRKAATGGRRLGRRDQHGKPAAGADGMTARAGPRAKATRPTPPLMHAAQRVQLHAQILVHLAVKARRAPQREHLGFALEDLRLQDWYHTLNAQENEFAGRQRPHAAPAAEASHGDSWKGGQDVGQQRNGYVCAGQPAHARCPAETAPILGEIGCGAEAPAAVEGGERQTSGASNLLTLSGGRTVSLETLLRAASKGDPSQACRALAAKALKVAQAAFSSPEDEPRGGSPRGTGAEAPASSPMPTVLDSWLGERRREEGATGAPWVVERRKRQAEDLIQKRRAVLQERLVCEHDGAVKTRVTVELKQLQLLPLQRRLRREFLYDMLKPVGPSLAHLRGAPKGWRRGKRLKTLERLQARQQEERQRQLCDAQKEFFRLVEQHGQRLADAEKARRERVRGVNQAVRAFHKRKEKLQRERAERLHREKISLLKANDLEGYLRTVQDAKSGRVQQLLKETEVYLQRLGAKVVVKQQLRPAAGSDVPGVGKGRPAGAGAMPTARGFAESNEKYYELAHRVKEHIAKQPSMLQGGQLREYQLAGLRWLVSLYNNRVNGILADEMGLGKTVQVIAFICHLLEAKGDVGPFLIVVPSSVLPNWVLEFDRWAPSVAKVAYVGLPDERRRIYREHVATGQFSVLLTTYDYLMSKADRPRLSKLRWHHLVIDEGHRIKNAACKLNAELKHYHASHRLLLTGTPIQNNLDELWTLLNFLLPTVFNSSEDFAQWFGKPFDGADGSEADVSLTEEESLLVINRLHQVLRPFMLRRLKEKVESELPGKVERLVRCEASAYQRLLMRHVAERLTLTSHVQAKAVHNTVMELRNVCNHPFLSSLHSEATERMLLQQGPHRLAPLVRACGKLEALDRILPKLRAANHRVLFFCTMTRLLDIMEEYLAWRGWSHLRLDGATSGGERGALIAEFNRPGSGVFIFLLSIRAGGVGINLQSADTVILYDTDWNPQVDLQAQARAHRIGQKRDVLVIRMETVGTVEARVRSRAAHKLGLANQSITAGFFDDHTSADEKREYLEALLREGSAGAEEAAEPVLGDAALNRLLARSEDEISAFDEEDRRRQAGESRGGEAGGKTPAPLPRLLGEEELAPLLEALRSAEESERQTQQRSELAEYGRGKRPREEIKYSDGISSRELNRLCRSETRAPVKKARAAAGAQCTESRDGAAPAKLPQQRPFLKPDQPRPFSSQPLNEQQATGRGQQPGATEAASLSRPPGSVSPAQPPMSRPGGACAPPVLPEGFCGANVTSCAPNSVVLRSGAGADACSQPLPARAEPLLDAEAPRLANCGAIRGDSSASFSGLSATPSTPSVPNNRRQETSPPVLSPMSLLKLLRAQTTIL